MKRQKDQAFDQLLCSFEQQREFKYQFVNELAKDALFEAPFLDASSEQYLGSLSKTEIGSLLEKVEKNQGERFAELSRLNQALLQSIETAKAAAHHSQEKKVKVENSTPLTEACLNFLDLSTPLDEMEATLNMLEGTEESPSKKIEAAESLSNKVLDAKREYIDFCDRLIQQLDCEIAVLKDKAHDAE